MRRLFLLSSLFLFAATSFLLWHHQQTAAAHSASSQAACPAISASPDYLKSGNAHDAITAINQARQSEHLGSLHLPSTFYQLDAIHQQFVLVNLERVDRGLQPLQLDATLSQMAHTYSQQMHDHHFFGHSSPVSGSFIERMNGNPAFFGHYRLAAENLAGNPVAGAGAIYEYLYNDAAEGCGHRVNILDPQLRLIGIGVVADQTYGSLSAQEFLTPAPWNPYQPTISR